MKNSKGNILVVTAYPVNNLTAGQGNINIITDEFLKRGYSISLVCFSYPNHSIERPERFEEILYINQNRPQRFLYAILFFFFFPLYTVRFSFRALRFIKKRADKASLIYLDYSQVFLYALFMQKVRQKICMVAHDVIYQKYKRVFDKKWYGHFIIQNIRFTEKKMFQKSDKISVLSFKDKSLISELYGITPAVSILKQRFEITPSIKTKTNLSHFVFLGAWNRDENLDGLQWFIENVYPVLDKYISFTIIGPGIQDDFKKNLPPAFKAVGFVEDLDFILQSSSALISPLFLGAGIKFKILDAFKNGCRVIGTDISFEGIDIDSGNAMIVANSSDEFVHQIQYCSQTLFDPGEIRDAFRNYIKKFDDTLEWLLRQIA